MTEILSKNTDRLPVLCWLVLPFAWAVFQLIIEITLSQPVLTVIHSEYGPHEILQFIFIASATVMAIRLFLQLDRKEHPWLAAWLGIAAVCCFFVSGEEISWGQTFVHWHTPNYWAHLNNQDETNLHNTSTWLNQKPRILLEIGVVTGGLIIPLLRKVKSSLLPPRFAIIYPPSILAVTAGLYVVIQFISTFGKHILHVTPFNRANEVEELYLYYFVLLYMTVLWKRIKNQRLPAEAGSSYERETSLV